MKTTCPIVDTHASWIALNPIHGCPFRCKYCFMNGVGNTGIKPKELVEPSKAVDLLLNYKLYIDTMPLCLFTTTDIFATNDNILYAKRLIRSLNDKKVKNPIIFITKCYVPNDFIDFIDEFEKKGMRFIFLLSFSGLKSDIENGINRDKIKQNFINLYNHKKNIIHYWRPFIPQNSDDQTLNDTLNFVSKYAMCSIVIGLKVQESFIKYLNFWNDVEKHKLLAISSEAIWTENAYKKLYECKFNDYKIFRTTSCALAYILKIPDYNCYFNSKICDLNNCDLSQKNRCKNRYKKIRINSIVNEFLNKIDKKIKYYIDDTNRSIIFDGELSTSEIVTLKYLTNYKIKALSINEDHYWMTGHNSERNLIL